MTNRDTWNNGSACPLSSEETSDVLHDYTAGRLDRERTALLEHHMASCHACASYRRDQASLWQTLDEWEPAPVSLDFNRRLYARMDAMSAQPWHRRLANSLKFGAWKTAIPLTTAALVVAAGFIMDHRNAPTFTQETVTGNGASVMEVDQVEKTLDDIQLLKQLDSTGTDTGAPRTL